MLRNVVLHGELGERFGKLPPLDIETATEGVRALCVMLPGFGDAMRAGEFHVIRSAQNGTIDMGQDLDLDQVSSYRLGKGDLHIVPVIAGSKRGGLLKVILGVALVGAAFVFSGGALGTSLAASGALSGVTYGNVAMIGLAVAASGVSELLSPEEKPEKSDESFLFSGPGNTASEGAAVPLVYGEVITGGVLISIGMDAEDLKKDANSDGEDDDKPTEAKDDDVWNNDDVWGHTR
jgi:predicted phage tail protein